MSKLFQITDDDLEVMERELPEIMDFCSSHPSWNNRKDMTERFEMIQKIVSNVRWNYGPPSKVERIDFDFNS